MVDGSLVRALHTQLNPVAAPGGVTPRTAAERCRYIQAGKQGSRRLGEVEVAKPLQARVGGS
jgi:hypothetical protein